MAAGNGRVSSASATAHTGKGKSGSRSAFSKGVWKKLALVSMMVFLGWAYNAIRPPPPVICGTPNGPPVTAPRIGLRDGRHLAYKESGVPKERAKYKIITIHGFLGSRNDSLFSEELLEELSVYVVSLDKPGYGESDPHPDRSVRSAAFDIEELADQLDVGPKFYVLGNSMGGYPIWGCLRYIPHRLAGAALVAPVINYRWPSFPDNLSREAYNRQPLRDQWALRVLYYTPWLTYWWMTQKWFPSSSTIQGTWKPLNRHDRDLFIRNAANASRSAQRIKTTLQQGVFGSLHREMMVMFGQWDFDPMELNNPFPNNDVSVHLWQGDEDDLVPTSLQRYIAKRLSWIHYHEIHEAGHFLVVMESIPAHILSSLLFGVESTNTVN